MSPITSIGPVELVILAGVTGLACLVPAIGVVALAAIFFRRRKAHPPEQE
jgi:branched-subunit amino acid permease